MVSDLIYLIRFLIMTSSEFLECILLDSREVDVKLNET